MRADYDSEANALSIDLVDASRWEGSEGVGEQVNVTFAGENRSMWSCSIPIWGLRSHCRMPPRDLTSMLKR
jgi:uncharacterized protein YuzE